MIYIVASAAAIAIAAVVMSKRMKRNAKEADGIEQAPSGGRSGSEMRDKLEYGGERFQGARCIIVVDDQKTLRGLVADHLRSLEQVKGLEVLEASTGEEALALFDSNWAECVLLDIKLPDMDGVEVLRRMRNSCADTPVILMSGYCEPSVLQQARQLGMFAILDKPFDMVQLESLVLDAIKAGNSLS